MKSRKIKARIYIKLKHKFKRNALKMKFIELNGDLYPLNDRVIFRTKILDNGSHELHLNYTDGNLIDLLISDITNQKNLSTEKKIEYALKGKVREISF